MPVYPRVKKTERIRSLFQKVATTNHYEVFFNGFAAMQQLRGYITQKNPRVSNFFISRDLGLLCNSAELPATSFATAQVEGNRMGIIEKMAHTRVYTDSAFTFYVDSDYRTLQFFEMWHEFIASGSHYGDSNDRADTTHRAYYHRMQWPTDYKVDTIRIQKFNKDHFRNVEYTFLNAFPVAVSAMPVSYDGNQVLECQVTFTYDRYFFGPITSVDKRTFYPNDGVPTPTALGNQVKESTNISVDETVVYDSEVEDQEWGPNGQPTASEQLALYKASLSDTEE